MYFGRAAAVPAPMPRRLSASGAPEDDHDDEIRTIEMDSPSARSMGDPAVQKSLFEMFNKRGYNLQSPSGSSAVNFSFTSTASTSSVISFREPVHGQTPIHIAIRRGDVQVVEALLKNDADLTDIRDDHGNTPLHFAVGTSRRIPLAKAIRMVALLLNAGANATTVNNFGRTPIMVHLLTAQRDDPTILTMLIAVGGNVNSEVDRVPLLHIAATNNLLSLASTLVAHGADIHATNQHGLYLHQVASPSMLVSIIAHITEASPYIPTDSVHHCMDCGRVVKRKVVNPFGWLFRTKSQATNCFHCGWIFCSVCTTLHPLKDALPPTFHRDEPFEKKRTFNDKRFKNIRCCRTCTQILRERLSKRTSLH
ncbi:hypothetical protein AC1031_010275 [Aphanomyces cochlioides]|nr:hypothetical protein AC1031_010275 [Aphanomyces cochlioides]